MLEENEITENIVSKGVQTEQLSEEKDSARIRRIKNSHKDNNEWQKKLLPFMMLTLTGLTLFFIVASYVEFRGFKDRLDRQSNPDELKTFLDNAESKYFTKDNSQQNFEYTKWRTMVWLEKESINRRYTHSNTLILARMWTRYVGFLVGMIMAIVGAVFILGKLRESETQLSSETNLFKVSVTSASPGIILATLGTILLLTTVVITTDAKVADGSLYLQSASNRIDSPPSKMDVGDTQLEPASTLANLNPTSNSNSNLNNNASKHIQDDKDLDKLVEESK